VLIDGANSSKAKAKAAVFGAMDLLGDLMATASARMRTQSL
jgi:hypothetical protein